MVRLQSVKMLICMAPSSSDAYESLRLAYQTSGEKQLAVASYKKGSRAPRSNLNYEVTSVVMTVSRANDRLFVQFPHQPKIQIFPENVRDYFFKTFDTQITFVTDSSGRATDLIMHEGGTDLYAKRIK